MRFELTCPEGYARLPSEWATDLPNASAWRRATESNRHPEGALVLKTSGGPSARTLQKWWKGRVSNPHVPKDRPASNGPPLGRNSAYLSVDRRPRLELGKTWGSHALRPLQHPAVGRGPEIRTRQWRVWSPPLSPSSLSPVVRLAGFEPAIHRVLSPVAYTDSATGAWCWRSDSN